jgi:hypothetical protein
MRKTELAAFLFMGLTPSFAQLGIAPQHENGEAIVVNKCGVPVYYVSMGDSGSFKTLSPGGVYREQFRLRYLGADYPGEDKYGSISIMLSPNQTITAAVDKQQAFFQITITQFEYTYHPLKPPGLWYDISNVNGYVYNTDNGWNGIRPWPFQEDGLIVEGTSEECATVVCPGGNPNGNSTCIQAYTHSKDDWASHSCRNSNSIVLTLCTEVSALNDVIDIEFPTDGGQELHRCSS